MTKKWTQSYTKNFNVIQSCEVGIVHDATRK